MPTTLIPERIDHRKLASQAGLLEGTLPLGLFQRFAEMVSDRKGEVHLMLAFSKRDSGTTKVDGSALSTVEMVCQNCMEPFQLEVSCDISTKVLTDESEMQKLEEMEDAIVEEGRIISVADLVEDHLILALPMIPRHEVGKCLGSEYGLQKETSPKEKLEREAKKYVSTFC
jgi:uncharacterized protein